MPRSPAGPGRPFCASDRGTPDAKQVKIDVSVSGRPAIARAVSGAAKGAPDSSAAASSSTWPQRPMAPARREAESRVTSVAAVSGGDPSEPRPAFEIDETRGASADVSLRPAPSRHRKRRETVQSHDMALRAHVACFQFLERRLRQCAIAAARRLPERHRTLLNRLFAGPSPAARFISGNGPASEAA